jgi:hypothetical protein
VRVLLNSPLAAASRTGVYRRRTRQRPRERGLRLVAATSAFVLHVVFLIIFVFGPAYDVQPPHASKVQALRVRLIDLSPPPVRGTPPRQVGPRHQGRTKQAMAVAERSANVEAAVRPPAAVAEPLVAQAARPKAPAQKRPVASRQPTSPGQRAPAPQLKPIPLAGGRPTVALSTPSVRPPVPPPFQPRIMRMPQREGNRPMLPAPSLAMPDLPTPSPPAVTVPSIALQADVLKTGAPASIPVDRPQMTAAAPSPELQAVPLPTRAAPAVDLQTRLSAPVPRSDTPQVQAPAVEVAQAQFEVIPAAPEVSPPKASPAPAIHIDVADKTPVAVMQPAVKRPQLDAPTIVAAAMPGQPTPTEQAAEPTSSTPPPATISADAPLSGQDTDDGRDVSRAPDAIPQGSDFAVPGRPDAVAAPTDSEGKTTAAAASSNTTSGEQAGRDAKDRGIGLPGASRSGTDLGTRQGQPGDYVQLKPTGDTEIMRHGTSSIRYEPTRFDQDWTPAGESSIDTALRHAVEKVTVKHTFHLPRGLRVECSITPLLPMALLGCRNPDPPPVPVAEKVYERMRLAPANPLASPAPAASASTPAVEMVKVDNGARCAVARVAGGPLPPDCENTAAPAAKSFVPVSASSSWVPASDQFH